MECEARFTQALEAQRKAYEKKIDFNTDVMSGEMLGVLMNAENIAAAKTIFQSVKSVGLGLVIGAGVGGLWHLLKNKLFHKHKEPPLP